MEDLVRVPDTRWLVGSSFRLGSSAAADGGGLYLIDTVGKTASRAKITLKPAAGGAFQGCPAPDLGNLNTHGLELRPGSGRPPTLYAVNHGGRESIEVFEVDVADGAPSLSWTGCILLPDGVNGNSVAALPGGALAVSKFQDADDKRGVGHILAGDITGTVYLWKPGSGFTELKEARLAGDNGLTASPDGKWLFVNAYGGKAIWRFALDGSSAPRSVAVDFRPDNLRWAEDGAILATGQFIQADAPRGPHGWAVVRVDPASMTVSPVLKEPGRPEFANATVALQVGKTLWIGTFSGDRIAYAQMK